MAADRESWQQMPSRIESFPWRHYPRTPRPVCDPIDLTGDADIPRYEIALETVIKDGTVDAILLIFLFQVPTLGKDAVERVASIVNKSSKPIVVVAAGGTYTKERIKELEAKGIPCYQTPERGIRALAALCHYQAWKKEQEDL